ncbi:HpcH/HpaI aldolase/citrate lyase family protein [Sphingomonas azotifigens]|uniref:HpcH/HpaI aldolase/citrate lyase family protein n=1 Tax=Sphingomonas azotifigens TaxID=330920 RepID=UPI000A026ACC|nr:CoA ester lyase [Sphingomonas azotifigens]
MTSIALAPRTALFLPASNPRAIAKARTLACDMVILDLEDAVKPEDKNSARQAAIAAAAEGFGERLCAIRLNGVDSDEHAADLHAVAASAADMVVVPKVEDAVVAAQIAQATGKQLLAMIETPAGVLAAPSIAGVAGVAGLIAGTNDLKATLGIPASAGREGLALALQTVVLAARAGRAWALDGVFNALADPEGLAAECRAGRALGFDGKTLIHPGQLATATEAFAASRQELDDARALLAAAGGGAERFRDRMIEAMHVAQARILLQRAGESE